MSLKKLSVAAVISVGLLTSGISASMAKSNCCPPQKQAKTNCKTLSTATPICKRCLPKCASSYGGGAAGTFKTYGTMNPWGGNVAGATEISSFRSQVNMPTGAAASMAEKGIYGNCLSCGKSSSTGGAASIIQSSAPVITIQKQPASACPNSPVATPETSNFTGGAAAAEREGMKCMDVQEQIPVAIGRDSQICPASVPACVEGASACKTNANAPKDFNQPCNPGSIGAIQAESITGAAASPCPQKRWWQIYKRCNPCTGGAAQIQTLNKAITKDCGSGVMTCPAVGEIEDNPMLELFNSSTATTTDKTNEVPIAGQCNTCPQVVVPQCPQSGCTTMCPVPLSSSNVISIQPLSAIPIQPWQITGGAASLPCKASTELRKTSENVEFLETQAYSYPSLSKKTNVVVSTPPNQIVYGGGGISAANPIAVTPMTTGYYANNAIYGYNQGYVTGAAAPISSGQYVIQGTSVPTSSGYYIFQGGAAPVVTTKQNCGCVPSNPLSQGASVSRINKLATDTPITIQSQSGMTLQRYSLVPVQRNITGAAAPLLSQFIDVPANFWASREINKLASAGIISGYPDKSFRPCSPVSRAEFASMLVNGLNLQCLQTQNKQLFSDVPTQHWAALSIDRVYNKGLVAGYPNCTFRPYASISRAEALTTMSKTICPDENICEPELSQLLNKYSDGCQVPSWARMSVAKAIKSGVLENALQSNMIKPNDIATRADIASMLSNVRQTLALEPKIGQPCPTGAAASIQQQTMTIPTLNVKFKHEVSARTGHVGDKFTAITQEDVTINNCVYPCGSLVNGKIVEILRPGNGQNGALKLAFLDITSPDGRRSALPKDVITAQIQNDRNKTTVARIIEFPIVLPSRVIGITGRTVGSMAMIAGNAAEQVVSQGGVALGQLATGQFAAAGRSTLNSGIALVKGPVDIASAMLSGGTGVFNVSTDEIGYVFGSDGKKIARILPRDNISVAFGCLD